MKPRGPVNNHNNSAAPQEIILRTIGSFVYLPLSELESPRASILLILVDGHVKLLLIDYVIDVYLTRVQLLFHRRVHPVDELEEER